MSEKKPSKPSEPEPKPSSTSTSPPSPPVTRKMTEAEKDEWIPYAVEQANLNRAHQAENGNGRLPRTPEEEAMASLD